MIPQITGALSQGFTASQIISFLMRQFPSHSKQIQKAISSGFSAEQIIKFLAGGKKALASEPPEMGTEHARTRGIDIKRREDVDKGFGTAAGLAGAGIAGSIASPMAAQALQRAAPQLLGPGAVTQTHGQSPTQLPPGQPQLPNLGNVQPTSQPPISPNIPQPQVPIQPEVKPINIGEILNKHGLTKHIDELSSRTKDPNTITALLYNKFPKEMKEFQKEVGKPMEEAIAEFMGNNTKPIDIDEKKPLTREEALGKFRENIINKGSVAASPQGIGEIKEIRNGKAIIEVDGKKHQVNEDELIESPLPEKDLADLYEELTQGIEKKTGKQISRNVEWAGYDPNTNELAYKPHGSDQLYAYDEISPKDVELLTSFLTQRKSTGENFIGAWEAGTESPIGAAMYQLIKKLQSERGGKGNEYKNKFMTIYDALEPAKKAIKERYAERKKKAKKPRSH